MRLNFYYISSIIITFFIILINHFLFFPNTKWVKNSPSLYSLSSTNAIIQFETSTPSVVYWRIYSSNSPLPKSCDMTNISKMEHVLQYGGGIIDSTSYYGNISNLSPKTAYTLVSIPVPKLGKFPKEITTLSFSTP